MTADVGGAGTVFALPAIENLLDRHAVFVPTIDGPARQSFRVEGLTQGEEVDGVELGPLQQGDVLVRYTPGSLDQVMALLEFSVMDMPRGEGGLGDGWRATH